MSAPLLESAVNRPVNLAMYCNVTDAVVLGVSLMAGIGKSHCFLQGNKRTAFIAGMTLIRLNRVNVVLEDTVENAQIMEDLIVGTRDEAEVVTLMQSRVW